MSGFIIIALIIVLLIGWSAWNNKRNKGATWTGIIIDKKIRTKSDLEGDAVSKIPVLTVKLDGNYKIKDVEVTVSIYDALQVGDSVTKVAGTEYPTISLTKDKNE